MASPRPVARVASGNGIIDSLPGKDARAILAAATLVAITAEEVLYRPADRLSCVYFPIDCRIAIVHEMTDGSLAEFSAVGRHGLTGERAVLGLDHAAATAICSVAGTAYRVPLARFLAIIREHAAVRDKVLRYIAAVITGIGQLSICNRFHTAEQRCARWLLLAQSAVGRDTIEITHAFLGRLLGMMRPAVSAALAALVRAGAIELSRGAIRIRSRSRLQAVCCECYELMSKEFRALAS